MNDLPYTGKIAKTFNLTITDLEKDAYGQFGLIHDSNCHTLEEAMNESWAEAKKFYEDDGTGNIVPFMQFTQTLDQEPTLLQAYKGWKARCGNLMFEISLFDRIVIK